MNFDRKAAGQTVAARRTEKGLSQEVLSGLAGIARSHLSMIETGTKQANIETLWKLAAALDLRPSQLVEKIEERARKNAEDMNP